MKTELIDNMMNTARRIQQNWSGLPIASLALAGLVGAGTMALIISLKEFKRNH